MALASAIGEELFFRGGLQTGLVALWGAPVGLVVAAGIFGVIHVPWNRRLVAWTATAGVMGLVFGLLYLATGELLAPIAAHAVINHENLRAMIGAREASPGVRLRMPGEALPRRARSA
jgi:membrane protease YdiL (CAAX protease family)